MMNNTAEGPGQISGDPYRVYAAHYSGNILVPLHCSPVKLLGCDSINSPARDRGFGKVSLSPMGGSCFSCYMYPIFGPI